LESVETEEIVDGAAAFWGGVFRAFMAELKRFEFRVPGYGLKKF